MVENPKDLLTLRPACIQDHFVFATWTEDGAAPNFHAQECWMRKYLRRSDIEMFMAIKGDDVIGWAQIDRLRLFNELRWLVAPAHRHKGFAKLIARELTLRVPRHQTIATIRSGNSASESVARAIGLTPTRTFNAAHNQIWA